MNNPNQTGDTALLKAIAAEFGLKPLRTSPLRFQARLRRTAGILAVLRSLPLTSLRLHKGGGDKFERNSINVWRLLQMLADREPVFETNLKKVKPVKGETQAEVEEYFREKYSRLKVFLRQAIDRKESIECSL
jgi:hypothetical protein